jgi:hypothetical protein
MALTQKQEIAQREETKRLTKKVTLQIIIFRNF